VADGFSIHRYEAGVPLGDDVEELLVSVFVGERFTPARGIVNLRGAAIDDRGTSWVARSDPGGEAIGTVFLVDADSPFRQAAAAGELEVHLMAVKQSERRRGVADALLTACLGAARARGAPRVVLSTQPSMRPAHALYEKHGFRRLPARDWSRSDGRRFLVYELALDG
jgi:ribosomal protein S18 acetylase RimI-like enzyme